MSHISRSETRRQTARCVDVRGRAAQVQLSVTRESSTRGRNKKGGLVCIHIKSFTAA